MYKYEFGLNYLHCSHYIFKRAMLFIRETQETRTNPGLLLLNMHIAIICNAIHTRNTGNKN